MNSRSLITISLMLISLWSIAQQIDTDSLLLQSELLSFEDLNPTPTTGGLTVVSASRSARSVEDLPVTVHVITRQEIIDNGYITLVDALKSLPTIKASQPGSGDEGESFLMRGLTGNYYSKILINNIPIQPSVVRAMPISAQLPVRQAERIEVIYGPASAVYGADAAVGVINIITKMPDKTTFAHADVINGTNEYRYFNFMAGGKAGRNKNILNYTMYGSHEFFGDMNILHDADNYNPMDNFKNSNEFMNMLELPNGYYQLALEGTVGAQRVMLSQFTDELISKTYIPGADGATFDPQTIMSFFMGPEHSYEGTLNQAETTEIPRDSYMLGFNLEFKGFRFSYDHLYRRNHSSLGRSPLYYKFNNQHNFTGEKIQRSTLSHTLSFEKISFSSTLSYLRYRMDEASSMGLTYKSQASSYIFSASDDCMAEELITYTPWKNLELVCGLQLQYSGNLPLTNELDKPFDRDLYKMFSTKEISDQQYGTFGYNPFTFGQQSVFFQAYYNWHKFNLVAGFRHDENTLYGHSTNPRLALIYKLKKKLSIRSSIGFAFKSPSGTVMYNSVAFFDQETNGVAYQLIPNTALKPERFISEEIGLRWDISPDIHLDISAYSNTIRKRISVAAALVDTLKYTNASFLNEGDLFARSWTNSEGSESQLMGIQTILSYKNIIPSIKLKADLSFNLAKGREKLRTTADTAITLNIDNELITIESSYFKINTFRQVPQFMAKLKLAFEPVSGLKVNLENILMDKSYRAFIPNQMYYENAYAIIKGYYNLDAMVTYRFNKHYSVFLKVLNAFDSEYAGNAATGLDVDMKYNPQLKRNIRFGLSFFLE